MKPLLLLLMAIVFGVTHAAAAPFALCRHVDAEAHVTALDSADVKIASEAHREEAAQAAAEKAGSLSDNVPAALANGILPAQVTLFDMIKRDPEWRAHVRPDGLRGRAIAPLLQPPLA